MNAKPIVKKLFILCGFAGLCLSCSGQTKQSDQVLDRWFEAQKELKSWNADFVQTRKLKTLTRPLTSSGHLWFAIPNQFRWEITQPSQTIALKENETMFVIYPKLRRAESYVFDSSTPAEWREALSMMEAGFPRNRAALDAQFSVSSVTLEGNSWKLALVPKSSFVKKMVTSIQVGLSTNDYSLTGTGLYFVDGSSMQNEFTNAALNEALDPGLFRWTAPTNYTVTKPFSK